MLISSPSRKLFADSSYSLRHFGPCTYHVLRTSCVLSFLTMLVENTYRVAHTLSLSRMLVANNHSSSTSTLPETPKLQRTIKCLPVSLVVLRTLCPETIVGRSRSLLALVVQHACRLVHILVDRADHLLDELPQFRPQVVYGSE